MSIKKIKQLIKSLFKTKVIINNNFSWLFVLLILLTLIARLYLIWTLPVDGEELNFFHIALNSSYKNLITGNYWAVDHPSLFFLILRYIQLLFHDIDINLQTHAIFLVTWKIEMVRMINFILFIISLIYLKKLSWLINNKINSWILPCFVSVSYYFFYLSILVHPYILTLTLFIGAIYYFIRLIKETNRSLKLIIMFSLFTSGLLYSSYSYFLHFPAFITICCFLFFTRHKSFSSILIGIFISIIFSVFQYFIFFINFFKSILTPPIEINVWNSISYMLSNNMVVIKFLPFWSYYFIFLFIIFLYFTAYYQQKTINNKIIILFFTIIFCLPIILVGILNGLFNYHATPKLLYGSSLSMIILIWFMMTHTNHWLIRLFHYFYLTSSIIFIVFIIQSNILKINDYNNIKIANHMLSKCNKNALFVINSEFYSYFPLVHYYLHQFNLHPKYRQIKQINCVLNNLVIFDTAAGTIINQPKNTNIKNIYFLDLYIKIFDQKIYDYINSCKTKQCQVIPAFRY